MRDRPLRRGRDREKSALRARQPRSVHPLWPKYVLSYQGSYTKRCMIYLCLSQTKLLENIDVLIKYLPREMLYTLINSHSILPSKLVKIEVFFQKEQQIILQSTITVFIYQWNVLALENVIFSSEIHDPWTKHKCFVSWNSFNLRRLVAYMCKLMQTNFLLNV